MFMSEGALWILADLLNAKVVRSINLSQKERRCVCEREREREREREKERETNSLVT